MPIVVSETAPPAVTGIGVSGGYLVPTSGALKRIYHVDRGYRYSDVAVTVRHRMNTTAPGTDYQAGVIARRLDSANQIVAYVTNGGAAPQLVVAKRDGDVMTTASVTITALVANTDYWLRLICDGNTLRGEHWIVEPTPMGTPATVLTTTLTGADATKFGTGIEGEAGIWWQPGASFANARIDSFQVEPYTYRDRTLPQSIALGGRIPGNLPALTDLHITPSGGAAAPVFGLAGWTQRPTSATLGVAPFGIIEGEAVNGTPTMLVGADANARGGSRLETTTAPPTTATAWWAVDARAIAEEDRIVEVFARVRYEGAPTWVLWADPRDGPDYGASRYGDRGTAGLVPASVTAGFPSWRMLRLGRIRLSGPQRLGIDVTWQSGIAAIDYLILVPARAFASSPIGAYLNASYPRFARSTNQTLRTLLSDGHSLVAPPDQAASPLREHGFGRRIELPPGNANLVAKLSSLVIDRPEVDGTTEQLAHSATVRASVLPRFAYA